MEPALSAPSWLMNAWFSSPVWRTAPPLVPVWSKVARLSLAGSSAVPWVRSTVLEPDCWTAEALLVPFWDWDTEFWALAAPARPSASESARTFRMGSEVWGVKADLERTGRGRETGGRVPAASRGRQRRPVWTGATAG